MKRILIVDDNQSVCEELEDRIEAMGHEAFSVGSRSEALEELGRGDCHFDLIMLDLEIPVRPDGPTRVATGSSLLDHLVASAGAPPVIVITSHGKGHHKLCQDVLQRGAAAFVTKPFDDDPPEDQIRKILERPGRIRPRRNVPLQPFEGGELVVHDSHIELTGVDVGCSRGSSLIRRIITILAPAPGAPGARFSGKRLAESIGNNVDAPSIAAAIKDFRNGCIERMRAAGWECGKNAVIETPPGNGYRINPTVTVRAGHGDAARPQVEVDAEEIERHFRRTRRMTRRQIGDAVTIPALRVKAALGRLAERKRIKHVGGSGVTTTYELSAGA